MPRLALDARMGISPRRSVCFLKVTQFPASDALPDMPRHSDATIPNPTNRNVFNPSDYDSRTGMHSIPLFSSNHLTSTTEAKPGFALAFSRRSVRAWDWRAGSGLSGKRQGADLASDAGRFSC